MPRRSLLTGVLLGAGSVIGTVLVRRRAARRRERIARSVAAAEPECDLLAGPELGAVALVAAASLASRIPFVIVRKEAKEYGTGKRLEGAFEPGARVCLVEDVVTSGGAALSAGRGLREAGLECGSAGCGA